MIRLHHSPGTRSVRSLWLLEELGVPYDLVSYALDKSLRAPDYLALNPAGRVPALEIDGFALFESGAITELLCERFSPDVLGRPAGHPQRAAWLQWVHYAETVSQHCANLTQQHLMLREDHMRSPIIMHLESRRLAKTIGVLDAALADVDYLLGDFSAADIGVGQAVEMGRRFVRLDDLPRVADWHRRLSQRPGFVTAHVGADVFYPQAFYDPWPLPQV
ncbi:glutathione S-transferase family protein [Loktanella sp. SALINAS62]|uniref:glutathione S-transferase family protein n=1 Tax=Loktanella sp. SALINAS62 TaxID=2706124 RepID=UPI001B8D034B|nr:glutathione S-transferase family protein [Loktanella sp. SALINAS62]MBS1304216.1 glutathione S-transferase family protein [Loktanella sp. SALINAS62]